MTIPQFRKTHGVDLVLIRREGQWVANGPDAETMGQVFDGLTVTGRLASFPAEEIDAYLEAFATIGMRVLCVADPFSVPLLEV